MSLLGGQEGGHLHDQRGPGDIGEGMPAGGARPVDNDGAASGHQHILRMVVSVAQCCAIGKLFQPVERRLTCRVWDGSGVLDLLDQLLTLRREIRERLGVHCEMQVRKRMQRAQEGPGSGDEVLHETGSSNPLEEDARSPVYLDHATDGWNGQAGLGQLAADVCLLLYRV